MKFRNPFTVLSLALSLALSASPLKVEDSKPTATSPLPRAEVQTAVFNIQHADVKALTKLLGDFSEYLSGSISCDAGSRTIAVVGSKELVSACTEAIKRLDVPAKSTRNFEFTFYILVASKKPIPDGNCPPTLEAFCDQMKGLFKGFRLLETIRTRTTEGKYEVLKGVIAPTQEGGETMPYRLDFQPNLIADSGKAGKPVIRTEISFRGNVPIRKASSVEFQEIQVNTTVNLQEGQDVGVGTLSQGTPGESLCIVVRTKVLD